MASKRSLSSVPDSTSKLTPFDGKPVVRTSLAVTGAGDGLSAAMSVDPVELHLGQSVVLVIECVVAKVRFEPDAKDRPDDLNRVHILRAGTATFIDREIVAAALDEQARKIDEARGVLALPFDDDDADTLDGAIEAGI